MIYTRCILGGRSAGDILELLHDGSDNGLTDNQRGALGIANGIGLAREFGGDAPIAIVLGDTIIRGSLRKFADAFVESTDEAGAVLKTGPRPIRWPVEEPILSGRDRANPRLREAPAEEPVSG